MSDRKPEGETPDRTRRKLVKSIGGTLVAGMLVGGLSKFFQKSPDVKPPEQSPREVNLAKAAQLLEEVGIKDDFTTASAREMFETSEGLAKKQKYVNKIWKIFTNTNNNQLGLAINNAGEPIILRNGSTNKPEPMPGLDLEAADPAQPRLIYTHKSDFTDRVDSAYGVVGYSNSEQLEELLKANPQAVDQLLTMLFSHYYGPVAFLHLGNQGMPTVPFNPPGFASNPEYQNNDVPSPKVEGYSSVKYIQGLGTTTRADIFINLKLIKNEADILGLPVHAVLAGYLANEAYGIATDSERLLFRLGEHAPGFEVGSTGADWATRIQVTYGAPNTFFTPNILRLIEQLASSL